MINLIKRILVAIIKWFMRLFRSGLVIYSIDYITPVGFYAWVNTNFGRMKKPTNAIPDKIKKYIETLK